MFAKRLLGGILVVLSCAAVSFAGEFSKQEAVKYYNEGVGAQEAGDMESAKSAYQKAILVSDRSARDTVKAVYNNLGVMYSQAENWEKAAEYFNEALTIDADYKEANFNVGILYAKMGYAQKALAYWSKALNKTGSFIVQGRKEE